jgi:hypothetical protein
VTSTATDTFSKYPPYPLLFTITISAILCLIMATTDSSAAHFHHHHLMVENRPTIISRNSSMGSINSLVSFSVTAGNEVAHSLSAVPCTHCGHAESWKSLLSIVERSTIRCPHCAETFTPSEALRGPSRAAAMDKKDNEPLQDFDTVATHLHNTFAELESVLRRHTVDLNSIEIPPSLVASAASSIREHHDHAHGNGSLPCDMGKNNSRIKLKEETAADGSESIEISSSLSVPNQGLEFYVKRPLVAVTPLTRGNCDTCSSRIETIEEDQGNHKSPVQISNHQSELHTISPLSQVFQDAGDITPTDNTKKQLLKIKEDLRPGCEKWVENPRVAISKEQDSYSIRSLISLTNSEKMVVDHIEYSEELAVVAPPRSNRNTRRFSHGNGAGGHPLLNDVEDLKNLAGSLTRLLRTLHDNATKLEADERLIRAEKANLENQKVVFREEMLRDREERPTVKFGDTIYHLDIDDVSHRTIPGSGTDSRVRLHIYLVI